MSADENIKIDYACEQAQTLLNEVGMKWTFNKINYPKLIYPLSGAGGFNALNDKTLFNITLGKKGAIELIEKEKVMKTIRLTQIYELRDITKIAFSLVYINNEGKAFLAKYAFQSQQDCEDVIYLLQAIIASKDAINFRLKYSQLQLHEGIAYKKGKSSKFAERYLRLFSNRLLVYRTKGSVYPVNVFTLDNTKELTNLKADNLFGLDITKTTRQIIFKTKDPSSCKKWLQILQEEREHNYVQTTEMLVGTRKLSKHDELDDHEKFFCDLLIKGIYFDRYDELISKNESNCYVHISADFKTLHWGADNSLPLSDMLSVSMGRKSEGFRAYDLKYPNKVKYNEHCLVIGLANGNLDLEVNANKSVNPKKDTITYYNAFSWVLHVTSTLKTLNYVDKHLEYEKKIEKYINGGTVHERRAKLHEEQKQSLAQEKELQKRHAEQVQKRITRLKEEAKKSRASQIEANKTSEATISTILTKAKQDAQWATLKQISNSNIYNLSPTAQIFNKLYDYKVNWQYLKPKESLLMYPIYDLKVSSTTLSDKNLFCLFVNSPARIELVSKERVMLTIALEKVLRIQDHLDPYAFELEYAVATAEVTDRRDIKIFKFVSRFDQQQVLYYIKNYLKNKQSNLSYGQILIHHGSADKKGKKNYMQLDIYV